MQKKMRADRIKAGDTIVVGERPLNVTRVSKGSTTVAISTREKGGMTFRSNAKVKKVVG